MEQLKKIKKQCKMINRNIYIYMHYSLLRFFNYSFPFMYFYITKIWTFIYYIQVVFEFLHFVYLFRCYGHLIPIYPNAHIFLIIYFYFTFIFLLSIFL